MGVALYSGKTSKDKIEKIFKHIFFLSAIVSTISIIVITLYMVLSGGPAIFEVGFIEFIFGTVWEPTSANPKFGILPMILSSIVATFGAVIVGVPLGVFGGVFISQICPKKLKPIFRTSVELLAGIPSVVFGLVGMLVVVPVVADIFNLPVGSNLFSAIVILTIMILPTIIAITDTSLRSVSLSLKESSLGLGATSIQTIFKVLIPSAKSGIMSGVVLGVGRAVGETMAVIMVAGNVVNMPKFFDSVRLMTTGIVLEMSYAGDFHRSVLFGIGLILFIFILILNILLNIFLKRAGNNYE